MAASANPFQLDDPNAILASQNAQITSDLAGQGRGTPLSQYGAGLGTLFSRFVYGDPQVQKAQNVQNAANAAMHGLAPQGEDESDIQYAIRSARAMHDAVAPYDSAKASQILDHIVTLNQAQTQQDMLKETTESRKAAVAENLLSKGSYVVGSPNGQKTFWRGDLMNTDGSLNTENYQAMQAALKANPGAVRQTEGEWANSKGRFEDQKIAGQLLMARQKAALTQDPLDPDTLAMAVADVRVNGKAAMGAYAGYGQAGQARRDQINAALSKDNNELGLSNEDMVAYRMQVHANANSIVNLQKFQSMLSVNAALAHNNGDRILALVDSVNPSRFTTLNDVVQYAKKHTSDADTNEFASVLNTFQTEAARIVAGSPSGAGILSDTARHELQQVVDGSLSPTALKRVVERLYAEFDVKRGAYGSEMRNLTGQVASAVGGNPYGAPPSYVRPGDAEAPAASLKDRIDAILGGSQK